MTTATRNISLPIEYLDAIHEIEGDWGKRGFSKFVRHAIDAYLAAKGTSGRSRAARDQLGVELLKAQIQHDQLSEEVTRSRRERLEKRLEDALREEAERKASGAASLSFASAEELVAYYRPRLPHAVAENWRNLAQRHDLPSREVVAVASRASTQAALPRQRRPPRGTE